jgi:hypothetical protein
VQPPVVAIYQNAEHVAGLVQQLFDAPLITSEVRDLDRSDEDKKDFAFGASIEGTGKFSVPLTGGVGATVKADVDRATATAITTSSRSSQSFVYSQAYYLNVVRRALADRELLVNLSGREAVADVQVGSFVEFRATFTAPTLPSIIDVFTPDLVGAIVEFTTRRKGWDSIDFADIDSLAGAAQELEMKAVARRDLAASVTRAVQADFRREHTREYYGAVVGLSSLTAITICDADQFLVHDADRLLDGSYRVLGKVTSKPRKHMPVFERNKMLNQVDPTAVDAMLGQMKEALETQTGNLPVGQEQIEQLMNVKLDSRVPGKAFRVVPVAIYV